MSEKVWQLKEEVSEEFRQKFPEMHPVTQQLLWNRGLDNQQKVDEFFNPDYSQDVHDPFLFRDMEGAVERIFKAVENKELIVVYGDYDVDGVSGATILATTLKRLGTERIHTHLPHREREGYGLNTGAVDEFVTMEAGLLITVDCGIANVEETAYAKDKGLDVIIVDHHHPKESLPPADFIIHAAIEGDPYPFKGLSGGGTAFKLAQAALSRSLNNNEAFEKWLLDLVAMSTIADMMELLGENRTLVKYGLMVLNKTPRLGLKHLIDIAKIKKPITGDDIGWRIGPRLNAAGRMDHANVALELLMTTDDYEARRLAELVNRQNTERQKETERMIGEIHEQIGEVPDEVKGLAASSATWPVSLLGLAAGRIAQKHARPTFIMSEFDDKVMGSGRAPEGVNLLDLLKEIDKLVPLEKYGGHAQACGFTMGPGKAGAFSDALDKVAREMLAGADLRPRLHLEAPLKLGDVTWRLWDDLEKFEPHGKGNERPLFLIPAVQPVGVQLVGNGEKHLKLQVSDPVSGVVKPAIAFGLGKKWGSTLTPESIIDLACEVDVNEWNGNRELQIKVEDIRLSE